MNLQALAFCSPVDDAEGRILEVTDPRGIVTRNAYDLLGRTTSTTEAYTDGTPSAGDDRITRYTYDGNGNILTLTADLPSGQNDQVTQYVYGVTTSGGSSLASNDLLEEVRYPNASTGAAGTASSDKEQYTYNALGQAKTLTDKNGNVHTYSYDVLGRQTADAVTTLGSGVDGSVRRLETAYNTQGLAYLFTSYDASSGGSVVNQVQRVFNGLGQLTTEYQAHSGAVNTSTTPKVQYAYTEMAGGANHSRLKSMTYPNGRVLRYEYSSGLDDSISRLSFLADDSSGSVGTHLEEYSYLGLSTIVIKNRPEPGTALTYVEQGSESNGDAGDQYTGLDRFGRVADQRWLTTSTSTATDRFQYGYDRDGNPLYKNNLVNTSLSELYHANGASGGYDSLNRLTDFRRGTLTDANSDGVLDTVSTATRTQNWSLDALGNSNSVTTDGTSQSRTHNSKNQSTAVGGATLTFDSAGNTTTNEAGQTFSYDAWNRLINNGDGDAHMRYDALNRRVSQTDDNPGYPAPHSLYYDGWQVIEERQAYGGCYYVENEYVTAQNVWSASYVDDLVLRDRDADLVPAHTDSCFGTVATANAGLEERLYAQQDANHNVTSITNASGTVQERFVYDPYGAFTTLTSTGTATSDVYAWTSLHQGTRWVTELGLYDVRNRFYSPTLMRWMQEDPAGYVDGNSKYCALLSSPAIRLDPQGLQTTQNVSPPTTRPAEQPTTGPSKGKALKPDPDGSFEEHFDVGEGSGRIKFSFSINTCGSDKGSVSITMTIDDPYAQPGQEQTFNRDFNNGYLIINGQKVEIIPGQTYTLPLHVQHSVSVPAGVHSGDISIRAVRIPKKDPDDKEETGVLALWQFHWTEDCCSKKTTVSGTGQDDGGQGYLPLTD